MSEDDLRSKTEFHDDPVEQLAFELAFELEEADLSRNDLVSINREKLRAIAARVVSRIAYSPSELRLFLIEHSAREVKP
jgi:hypothetical protein